MFAREFGDGTALDEQIVAAIGDVRRAGQRHGRAAGAEAGGADGEASVGGFDSANGPF